MAETTAIGSDSSASSAEASVEQAAELRAKEESRRRWLLLSPALLILLFAASGPLLIVLVYSFLKPGDYGGVIWQFSTDGWFNVFFEETYSTRPSPLPMPTCRSSGAR